MKCNFKSSRNGKMQEAKVKRKNLDEILELAEEEDVERKEYSIILGTIKSLHTYELEKKQTWTGSVENHSFFDEENDDKDLIAKAKLRVLKDGTWYVGSERFAEFDPRDEFIELSEVEDIEVELDEDAHPYIIHRYGDERYTGCSIFQKSWEEEYKRYSNVFLMYPENVKSAKRGEVKFVRSYMIEQGVEKVEDERSELLEKFYEKFPEMKDYEKKVEKTKQCKLRKKHGLSTENFDESELFPGKGFASKKSKKFKKFYVDFLKDSGYGEKIEKNETLKRKAFNGHIQNFADWLEGKGFEVQAEIKSDGCCK